ncbi:MAG: hypothetical protein WC799_01950 [Desulfobacteraceae bacterium]|jgi:hypothetical protein
MDQVDFVDDVDMDRVDNYLEALKLKIKTLSTTSMSTSSTLVDKVHCPPSIIHYPSSQKSTSSTIKTPFPP